MLNLRVLVVALIVCIGSSASAATLNVSGGQLLGASDVLVDGDLYDVEFLDGTCIDLFTGCDEASDFTFQAEAAALLASQALLDQVFINGTYGFDSFPYLTNGITDTAVGIMLTVFSGDGFSFTYAYAANRASEPDEIATQTNNDAGSDLRVAFRHTFAVWTPVPEPGTGALMALGLIAMGVSRRR